MLAHKNHETGREQSVRDHATVVARLCREYGAKIGASNTAELIGYYHDMGKCKEHFQRYIEKNALSDDGNTWHSQIGAQFMLKSFDTPKPLEQRTARIIALAIRSHHGGLIDCITTEGEDEFHKKIFPETDVGYEECAANFPRECPDIHACDNFKYAAAEIERLMTRIIELSKKRNAEEISFYIGLLERYLLSALLDADRYDTYCFEQEIQSEPDKKRDWKVLIDRLELHLSGLKKDSEINMLRSEISEQCKDFAGNRQGVFRLMVPTGGGKTLSSLRFALHHAEEHHMEHIYYIIPYTTIIDQNCKEIRDILKQDDMILEHHSSLVSDEERHKLLTERWNSPIIMTTMVQFLNTLFEGGTRANRRMHNLAKSVIIFDEIQSIPPRCIDMFNSAVNFLSGICGSTIVLCTATQPEFAEAKYPIVMGEPIDIVKNCKEIFQKLKRTQIIDTRTEAGYDADGLANFVFDKDPKNALIIMNTKKAAENVFTALKKLNIELSKEKQYEVFYLSTYLCQAHRMEVIKGLFEKLEDKRVICVSTQLIEAGINISFSCVVRSAAGLDSIAQAAGRCNRHGNDPCGPVYIIKSSDENLTRLRDIEIGQRMGSLVLDEIRNEPGAFDNDPLSPKAIERYFTYYYNEFRQNDEMSYPVKKEEVKLYDLLAVNRKGYTGYKERNKKYPPSLILNQAFHKAGGLFKAIDSVTVSVIVPHGKGAEIIGKLMGNTPLKDRLHQLKLASQYSVNLFEQDNQKLKNELILLPLTGGYALPSGFYSEEHGVVFERQPESVWNYMQ
ncbi:CRISPR-associated Cas3 family helicase [Anaerobacterium chartisolvens]|uniref:CRISPR-associated Cas3 family helicase n=1 Tax=Anaerobacterium chartisolvens TaxID=1297424 RepID=A0A369BFA6_9FIRM|nr:CRISPR-associated helicase Cas3' [Anaerobacterium chartisolvens]RCX20101.1 CRISPR-associated Cas3 family helicase [Anaerobacterium chartisolvens]